MKRRLARKPKRSRTLGPVWLRWALCAAAAFCMGLGAATAVQWVATGSLSTVWEWFVKWPSYLLLTAAGLGALVLTLGALVGRLWIAGALVGAVSLILSLVDYFKNAINGTPLELADFGLASQLGEVAGVAGELRPPVDFWMALAALAICVGILVLVRRLTVLTGRCRFLSFSVALALTVGLFTVQGAQAAGAVFGVDTNTRLAAANSHDTYGLTLSLWRDCFLQAKESPEGYGEAYMQQVLARIDEILAEDDATAEAPAVQPNIIMVLSESFYDLNRLPDLQYERDPLENFHALEREGIQLFILSNSRKPGRAQQYAEALGVPFQGHSGKPKKAGYLRAMERMGREPRETVMVGDQIFTDILGANNAGVVPLLVEPIRLAGNPGRYLRYAVETPFRLLGRRRRFL